MKEFSPFFILIINYEIFENSIGKNQLLSIKLDKLVKELENKYPVQLWISLKGVDRTISISQIVVDKAERNKGLGTKIMGEIIDFADTNGLRISLTPSSSFGGSKERLKKFYRRFDFKKNKDFRISDTMIREI